jgi:Flp pilus assembly protein TadD
MQKQVIFYISLVFLAKPCYSQAAARCEQWVAKVASAQGKVDIKYLDRPNWESARQDEILCYGDRVRTAKNSRLVLKFTNQAVATLDQNATLIFPVPEIKATSWFLKLLEGSVFFRSRKDQQLDIHTPFLNAVHKGTEFMVAVGNGKTQVAVFDGEVAASNSVGQVTLKQGFIGEAQAGQAPRVRALTATPKNAVQWTLYYPPIVDYQTLKPSQLAPNLHAALAAYQHGNLSVALEALDKAPATEWDSASLNFSAALLLTVGRVDGARQQIDRILKLEPGNSHAVALQAVIAVAQNQQDAALDYARKAVALNPKSATAQIALSYAYQSQFKVEEALKATQAATVLAPNNALAWARLAELQLSVGDRDAALTSAQKAQVLNPNLARTQTIKGFAELAENNIDKGAQAFARAISLDSSDPIARLGLGLTKIRQGQLEEGKSDLEIAVNLDPNNALLRSYLGKTFYELNNKDFAGKEFDIAKALDSKDPTPWFYDAILKQTTNRPIEALQDMQKAIEFNDNRGVYRSKLLLDSDNAARSASLGRIYNDLGFQQRGLLEGWKSINTDPGNYSAHRLLADNYAALPRHEVARVSELLKAQLLQPVNITPVQPQAAESNILILDGLGPSITSFNEYNPLFTRNRFALQASGFYGGNNTLSDEVVQSGVWDKFSYSLGQFHYQTDGFRPNNKQNKDIYNLFAQAEIAKNTNVQVELRRSEEESGDINQGFFSYKPSLVKKASRDINVVRGGIHHAFSENSHLLASVVHRLDEFRNDDGGAIVNSNAEGTQYELQHIFKHANFDLTSGMNYLSDQQGGLSITPKGAARPRLVLNNALEHGAFYLYSNIKITPELTLTAGFSQDFYKLTSSPEVGSAQTAELDRNPFNPKVGLIWMPTHDTTFRFAAFRVLKRGIIQKQTLEPTQVAGFNQFYDDLDGTLSERIGFGIDHKFNPNLYTGVEVSERFLETEYQYTDPIVNSYNKTNWKEKNARAYLNYSLNNLISVGINYNYEEFNRNEDYFDNLRNQSNFFTGLKTHRTQIFGNFNHPSGLIAKLSLTDVNQSGNFFNPQDSRINLQESNFWLLDTEIGYRLPKRHGLLVLGIKNLLNEKFNFQGTDLNYPMPTQGRYLFSRITLSF